MSKDDEKNLENRILALDKDYERVSIEIDAAERAASDGVDLSAIEAMKFGYQQRENIVAARSHLEGRLDYIKAQNRDRDNQSEAGTQKDQWAKKEREEPAGNWWRGSEQPAVANQGERTPELARTGDDWWRSNSDDREVEPDREPDRDR